MRESDFLKTVLKEKLANKEEIRQQALAQAEKGAVSMKKKLVTVALSLCLVVGMTYGVYAAADTIQYNRAEDFLQEIGVEAGTLDRATAKRVYRDMSSQEFNLDATEEVLVKRAYELGMEYVPQDNQHVYQALKNYSAFTVTNKISKDQVLALEAGMSYSDIIEQLGSTKDVGEDSHILQYLVDERMLLTLTFSDETEICPLSGTELLDTLRKVVTENTSGLSFDATVIKVDGNSILVDCPGNDMFDTALVGIAEDTVVFYAGGEKAEIQDLANGMSLIVTYTGTIRESYPPQITATEITIVE